MFKKLLLHQYIFPYVGESRLLLAEALFYMSALGLPSNWLVLYSTTVRPWAEVHAHWLSIWGFLAVWIVLALASLVIAWKFILPSLFKVNSRQSYMHDNPLVTDMQKALKELGDIKRELAELKGKPSE